MARPSCRWCITQFSLDLRAAAEDSNSKTHRSRYQRPAATACRTYSVKISFSILQTHSNRLFSKFSSMRIPALSSSVEASNLFLLTRRPPAEQSRVSMSPTTEPPAYDDAIAPSVDQATATTNPASSESNPLSRAQTSGPAPTQPRMQRRSSQPLPAYTRSRADDPDYIKMLEQWAQTKMYIEPGRDGSLNVASLGTRGIASVAGESSGTAVDDREERRRRERERRERERLESVRHRWRTEEGLEGEDEAPVVPSQRRGSRIGNALRRLSSRS